MNSLRRLMDRISPSEGGDAGSIPAEGTRMELSGSEPTDAWAVRNAAHALNPDGATVSGGWARTNPWPRRRFEIKSNFGILRFALPG